MTDLERWESAWEQRGQPGKKDWNDAADSWERKYRQGGDREAMSRKRITAVVSWLEGRGILTPDADVLDAGCGPGRFCAEFALRCRHVTGVDISEKMCRYGKIYCEEQGLPNVSFLTADFSSADLGTLGLERKFDLAFSSITPAVRGLTGLNNLIGSSRQWCFNASFVRENNRLLNAVRENVFGMGPKTGRGMHADWFYQLLNILWLRGYDPEIRYYDQSRKIRQTVGDDLVRVLTEHTIGSDRTDPEEERKVRLFLEERADEDGTVEEISEYRTAWLLWNVNDGKDRSCG